MLPYLIAGAIGFGIGKLFEEGGETFMAGGKADSGVGEYKMYKLRAEGLNDFINFLGTGIYFNVKSFTVEPIGVPDVVVSFESNLSLSELKSKLRKVQDSHVMLETIKPINEYTSERYAGGGKTYMAGGNPNSWSVSDLSNAKYLGYIEFQDNEGEYHNFEIMETDDRLVFGGMTNTGFIESGYIEKDGFSTDETLQSLIEDLEVYYNDGAEYTSQIVFNERMENGGEAGEKYILRRGTPIRKNIRKKRPKTREPKMVRTIFEEEYFKDFDNGGEADDKYGGQRNKIVTELKGMKGGLNNKAPYVFLKEGYIYVSAENGDNYADYYEYTIDEKLEDLADRYNTYWDWETAGSIVLAPIDTYAGGGVAKKRRRSASAQYGRSDRSVDKQLTAKPVGYRFSNAKANQLRKDPFAKPTEAQVKKYLGKGIYKENRRNRSDRDRNAKL